MNTMSRRTIVVISLLLLGSFIITLQFKPASNNLISTDEQTTNLQIGDFGDAFYTVLPTPTISIPDNPPPYVVPLCSFPNESTLEAEETDPSQFIFSEPQIIVTSTISVDIVGWLKGSNQLLITRLEDSVSSRSIELWDATTGKIQHIGQQPLTATRPIWLENAQGIAYQNWIYTDEKSGTSQWDLWLNTGQEDHDQLVVSDLLGKSISISSNGEIIRFASNKEELIPLPELANKYFQQSILPVNLSDLLQPKYSEVVPDDYIPQQFNSESSPDSSRIALFANPYFYLFDKTNSGICEVALGSKLLPLRFPLYARWSPDSHSIAMITTEATPGTLIEFTEITLLNALTGEQQQIQTKGNPVALAWSPESRYLLALVNIANDQWRPFEKLTLIDTQTGKEETLFPDQIFGGGTTIHDPGLAWSSDGKMAALKCPEWPEGSSIIEDRVCLILNESGVK